jgi:hypothetical protein
MSEAHRGAAAMATSLLLLSSAFVAIRIALPHLIAAGRTLACLLVASLVLAAAAPLLKVRRPERADLPRRWSAAGSAAWPAINCCSTPVNAQSRPEQRTCWSTQAR